MMMKGGGSFTVPCGHPLMHSMEQLYLDFEVIPEGQGRMDRGTYAFYALWDEILTSSILNDLLQRIPEVTIPLI